MRLSLDGFSSVEGASLQDASDELVHRLLVIAMAFRAGGMSAMCSECNPNLDALDFIWRLGEIAAAGGDIRELLFSPTPNAA